MSVCISLAGMLFSCQPAIDRQNAGVAISFDDQFIHEWHSLRPLFRKYGARATFFVTCGDTLTREQVIKLQELENDGHEIGFHGSIHGKSTELINALGPAKYAEQELSPGLGYLAAAGFHPRSYAHPGGNHNAQVDSVLFSKGFSILRDVAVSKRRLFGFQWYAVAPRLIRSIFYHFDQQKEVNALLIDTDQQLSGAEIAEAIQAASENGDALLLFGHKPLHKKPQAGEYGFDVALLEAILKEAARQQVKFYTMSELPGISREE
ncbi:polysaccharide deacetylase family protein [Dyadobacter sandarakinus]|uniref:Polysaccharide deacetylase family protein n=1 Tax=Dyadobacter sandarakinus TaxID=2747268 RepID=A0ABX7IAH9_9BACT|nr:polysaccharide deacetylase family protein [Dyadobacter sandarakinus]QRR03114.1 polysaccharide deacetylase family protein [Dyadobacter sandarakinus]